MTNLTVVVFLVVVVVVVVQFLLDLQWLPARAEIQHEGEGSEEDEGGGEDGDQEDGQAGRLQAGVEDDWRRDVSGLDVLHLDDVGGVSDQGEVKLLTGHEEGAEDGGVERELLVPHQIL